MRMAWDLVCIRLLSRMSCSGCLHKASDVLPVRCSDVCVWAYMLFFSCVSRELFGVFMGAKSGLRERYCLCFSLLQHLTIPCNPALNCSSLLCIHFHLLNGHFPDYKLLKGRGPCCPRRPSPVLPHTVLGRVIECAAWSQTDRSLNLCSATYQLHDFLQIT